VRQAQYPCYATAVMCAVDQQVDLRCIMPLVWLGRWGRWGDAGSNYTGLYDYTADPSLAKFGLVDYDWCADLRIGAALHWQCVTYSLPAHRSNAKSIWANQHPMDCDGMLITQAARHKTANPAAKVFVYRYGDPELRMRMSTQQESLHCSCTKGADCV
jgi:hypothetical protein